MSQITSHKIGLIMRLTAKEIDGITAGIAKYLGKRTAELRLYGSRAKDNLKGGDIDLLLFVADNKVKFELLALKPQILVTIKELIGEQKIDLKIASTSELDSDPFLQIVVPESVVVHSY